MDHEWTDTSFAKCTKPFTTFHLLHACTFEYNRTVLPVCFESLVAPLCIVQAVSRPSGTTARRTAVDPNEESVDDEVLLSV